MKEEKRGEFISRCRKSKGLSQEQLGELLNYSRNNISKWERGLSFPNDPNVLEKMAAVFNVNVEELLYGEKKTSKNNQEIIDNLVIEYKNKYKEIYRKNLAIIISIFFLIITIILFIYFAFIRGTISVYKISIDSEKFYMEDSMLLLSNNISTLNFNKINANIDEEIEMIKLYYYKADEKVIIFSGDNEPRFIEEDNGYNEYDLSKLAEKDIYLYIKTSLNVYDNIKLNVDKKYINNNIFPKTSLEISQNNSSNSNSEKYEDFLIENGFKSDDNIYFEKKLKENIYIIVQNDSIRINFLNSKEEISATLVGSRDSNTALYIMFNNGEVKDSNEYLFKTTKICDSSNCNEIEDFVAYINFLKNKA